EHCFYARSGRATYVSVTDKEAIDAFLMLSKVEGIIPAIESSHAVSYGVKLAKTLSKDKIVVINLSGRGDKDVMQMSEILKH
ncbi:MAG: tryptophan synthase subunit beta, partial [Oscillospiraceae bacterium]